MTAASGGFATGRVELPDHLARKARQPDPAKGWRCVRPFRSSEPPVQAGFYWYHSTRGILAISVTALAESPRSDSDAVVEQWLVTLTHRPRGAEPRRLPKKATRFALRAFGMAESEEDNHGPNLHRAFWLPIDPDHRVDCECKTDEVQVVEADGYRWSNAVDPADCRGCERARRIGGSCAFHPPEAA